MRKFLLLGWLLIVPLAGSAREFSVVAYNVENLFDADGKSGYDQFANLTAVQVLTKLQNTARVVTRFENGRGPDVLMLCELEVDATPGAQPPDYAAILRRYAGVKITDMLGAKLTPEIADLPSEALLLKALADAGATGYTVVVGDNVTAPGSDRPQQVVRCAIFTRFPVKRVRSHPILNARPILEVEVEVDGAPLYLFANHWKSGAGDPETEVTRIANAQTLRTRLDEILRGDPQADIIIGGDLNSQYNQKQRYPAMKVTAINDTLKAQGNELAIRGPARDLYNLWWELSADERGSDTYQGEWGTLMHLIVSRGLYDYRGVQYVDNSFAVGRFSGLNADAMGLPVRWTSAGATGSGFSDHFPVVARFVTVPNNEPGRWLALRRASDEAPADAKPVKINYAGVDVAKVALTEDKLAAGEKLRTQDNLGRMVRVEGTVAPGNRLAVVFRGETYDIYSPIEALRQKMRAEFKTGEQVRFYGELGIYRDRWQFVVHDAAWLR